MGRIKFPESPESVKLFGSSLCFDSVALNNLKASV